jgi:hypothetical protein
VSVLVISSGDVSNAAMSMSEVVATNNSAGGA